jgi:hypothetical protein
MDSYLCLGAVEMKDVLAQLERLDLVS